MKPLLVYVAGPLHTSGIELENVRRALQVAERIVAIGHVPFVPHLTSFWHLVFPHERDYWLQLDNAVLSRCDMIYRMRGESHGADAEVELAKTMGMRVYYETWLPEITLAEFIRGQSDHEL